MTTQNKEAKEWQWSCDACGAVGRVKLPKHTDVWAGGMKLLEAHKESSPKCVAGRDRVRVEVPAPPSGVRGGSER